MKSLITFIDYMAAEYKQKLSVAELFEKEGKHVFAQNMKDECCIVWSCLYQFCNIILTGSKFQSQKYYCRRILMELYPEYWEALESAMKKSRAMRAQQTRQQNAKGNARHNRSSNSKII